MCAKGVGNRIALLRPMESYPCAPLSSPLPDGMGLVFQPFRHFPFMARGFLIGSRIDLCETGLHIAEYPG